MTPTAAEQGERQTLPLPIMVLLGMVALGAFLSETKLVPGIRNNIGVFELAGGLLVVLWFLYFTRRRLPVRWHPLIVIVGLWFLVALASLTQLGPERVLVDLVPLQLSVVQTFIFLFQFVLLLALYNLLLLDEQLLLYVFRVLAMVLALVAVWVLLDQLRTNSYAAAGPFRNRSHMGLYMFGAFWILLIYRFWPGITWLERWTLYPIIGLVAYAIAASLRQSVYTAFILGLAGLLGGFFLIRGTDRFRVALPLVFTILVLGLLFLFGGSQLKSLELFQRELLGLDERLEGTLAADDDHLTQPSFDALQRQGALEAFRDHPVLGIGWLGFYRSRYSPTGNELHSTPLRILTELGVAGFLLYVLYLGFLLLGSVRLFLQVRGSPYQLSAFVLSVGLFSVTVSHYYNRMFTDRPYFILLVVFMVFEGLMTRRATIAPTRAPAITFAGQPAPDVPGQGRQRA